MEFEGEGVEGQAARGALALFPVAKGLEWHAQGGGGLELGELPAAAPVAEFAFHGWAYTPIGHMLASGK